MRRFLLLGALAFALSNAQFGIAAAAETSARIAGTTTIGTAATSGAVTTSGTAATTLIEHGMTVPEGEDVAAWSQYPGASAVAEPRPGAVPAEVPVIAPAARPQVPHVKPAIRRLANRLFNRTSRMAVSLTRNAMRFVGVPYVFGGTSTSGFDCSGYVQHVFAMLGVSLPRTADAQYAYGHRVRALAKGDLVFFQTYEPGPSHVGIYLGRGKFIHASSSHGVMVSHLSDSYWSGKYLGAKRVVRE